ncbi:YihY/virulence factor BrkB family protein [Spongisporangium articulatum]|uniref:YihY/virulence factor BrkB family protein n=1 Tax=Spongisporangium articulatum TaxID=3362603 RepID=A0ABW8AGQ5_9ACTN
MRGTERLDAFQQRHRWLGYPLAVIYKFFDDLGGFLAALITYYGFISIFPLLLLFASVLGFLLQGDAQLQERILDSALRQFPVIGEQLGDPQGLRGSTTAVVIGGLGSIYGALGVAQAVQNAMNTIWAVPRNRRGNPFVTRGRSVVILLVGGLTVVVTGGLSAFPALNSWGTTSRVATTVLATSITTAFFVFLFRFATAHPLSRSDVLPGAFAAALVWQLLQSTGAAYVGGVVRRADATNGVFAIVLGLIAWIYLAAVSMLLCAEANVVHVQRLYPRTLLTPFTDDVDLTDADRRAYTSYANAARTKEFESVDVRFKHNGQNKTANRLRKRLSALRERSRDR